MTCPKCGSDQVRLQLAFELGAAMELKAKGSERVCVCGHRWPDELPEAVMMVLACGPEKLLLTSEPMIEVEPAREEMRRTVERRKVRKALKEVLGDIYRTAMDACDRHGVSGGRVAARRK